MSKKQHNPKAILWKVPLHSKKNWRLNKYLFNIFQQSFLTLWYRWTVLSLFNWKGLFPSANVPWLMDCGNGWKMHRNWNVCKFCERHFNRKKLRYKCDVESHIFKYLSALHFYSKISFILNYFWKFNLK